MSRIYRQMHDAERYEARRRYFVKKLRDLAIVDKTAESPLERAPHALTWYVAMTEPRRERAALSALRQAGWQAWFPQETIWRENPAKRERAQVNVPLFGRYMFVAGGGDKPIGDCRHVSALLPYRVPARIILDLDIRQNGGEFKTIDIPVYELGQPVKAEFGNISELSGIVRHANHERVRILTTLFGAERELDIPIDRVRAA